MLVTNGCRNAEIHKDLFIQRSHRLHTLLQSLLRAPLPFPCLFSLRAGPRAPFELLSLFSEVLDLAEGRAVGLRLLDRGVGPGSLWPRGVGVRTRWFPPVPASFCGCPLHAGTSAPLLAKIVFLGISGEEFGHTCRKQCNLGVHLGEFLALLAIFHTRLVELGIYYLWYVLTNILVLYSRRALNHFQILVLIPLGNVSINIPNRKLF